MTWLYYYTFNIVPFKNGVETKFQLITLYTNVELGSTESIAPGRRDPLRKVLPIYEYITLLVLNCWKLFCDRSYFCFSYRNFYSAPLFLLNKCSFVLYFARNSLIFISQCFFFVYFKYLFCVAPPSSLPPCD